MGALGGSGFYAALKRHNHQAIGCAGDTRPKPICAPDTQPSAAYT